MLNLLNMENLHFFCLSHFSFVTVDQSLFLSLIFRFILFFVCVCACVFLSFLFFFFATENAAEFYQRVHIQGKTHTVTYV